MEPPRPVALAALDQPGRHRLPAPPCRTRAAQRRTRPARRSVVIRTARPARRLPALLAGLALLGGAAGCGTPSAQAVPAASGVAFDQALHDRLPEPLQADGLLEVATDATYPPASAYARDGRTIVGFEPDLGAALGRVLGVEVRFVRTDFSGSLPALAQGRVDAVISAMTDTAVRREQADFVDYFSAGTSVIVQRGNPHGIADLRDLCGRTVAAEAATVQVDLLARTQQACGARRIDVRQFPDNAKALLELRTGRAAAVLNDYPPAAALTTDMRTRADFQLASTVQYEPGFYGIAVRKTDPGLRDALAEALGRLVRSGEYAEILDEWGVSSGAVSTVSINGGTAG